jgi:Flp pilus assembly pilin Flp
MGSDLQKGMHPATKNRPPPRIGSGKPTHFQGNGTRLFTVRFGLEMCFGWGNHNIGKGDSHMKQFLSNFHREESGQDLLEYALVLAAVLAAVVFGSNNLASDITSAITVLNGKIGSAISAG